MAFSNGASCADVEFRTLEESGVEPPNPLYFRVHAAIAKVLSRSRAIRYYMNLGFDSDENLPLDSEDGSAVFKYKLAVLANRDGMTTI